MNHTPYVIALYIRLSVEDAKVESLSIENQKYALHQYVESVRMATKRFEWTNGAGQGSRFQFQLENNRLRRAKSILRLAIV